MRKRGSAAALFPPVRREVLGVTFRDPKRWWYLSEMADALRTSPSSLQRELETLTATGILEGRTEGRRTYYRANVSGALFHELRGIVRKTMGVPGELQAALAPIARKIALAFIYGSVARGTDRTTSDVDLLVVSDALTLEELYRRLAPAEKKLRRRVNPTLYTKNDFERRIKVRNPFLVKVLSRERIVLIGSENGAGAAR